MAGLPWRWHHLRLGSPYHGNIQERAMLGDTWVPASTRLVDLALGDIIYQFSVVKYLVPIVVKPLNERIGHVCIGK